MQTTFVVFLTFLIGINCANFENTTTSDNETTLEEFDMCKYKCGDDPYTYCKGYQDSFLNTVCVCPLKTQLLDRTKCTSWCTYRCGEHSNTVCSGDQTTFETTICGCKDDLNWIHDKYIRKCSRCGCKIGENCTFNDFYRVIQCKKCRKGYSEVNGICKGDCSSFPCKNGGRCKIEAGDIACSCVHPFTGEFCEKSVHCDPNPCKNGGTCISAGYTFKCACPDIYGGRNCSENRFCEKYGEEYCGEASCYVSENPTKVHCNCGDGQVFDKVSRTCIDDYCHPNPCKNGGVCLLRDAYYPGKDPYTCFCKSTHMGKNCTESTWCFYNGRRVCGDEATCQYNEDSGEYSCICASGETFDEKLKICKGICKPDPCVHGICVKDGEYDYHCSCFSSYRGKNCDEAISADLPRIVGLIVSLVLLGIGIVATIIFIRNRNERLRMRSLRSGMYQAQIAMPVTVGLN